MSSRNLRFIRIQGISSKFMGKQHTKSNLVQIHHGNLVTVYLASFTHSSLYDERTIKYFVTKFEAVGTQVLHNTCIAKYSHT